MSVVGPRPHAVAHNEQYRKLIKGTMLRHKVKPGITGWAQVNGLRGETETETLDKMRARVQYDIDYMRNWSLGFDLMIIGKTLAVVWRDQNAYSSENPQAARAVWEGTSSRRDYAKVILIDTLRGDHEHSNHSPSSNQDRP